jgi:DNA repair protein RecO (recombination protein O)
MLRNMVSGSPKPYSLTFIMSTYHRTQGFVLKKTDLREADQIFVVYTEDFGRVEVLGRGIRKIKSKIRSGIDVFYLSEIDFVQGKKQKTLTGATIIDKFINTRSSPEKLDIAHKISVAMDNLIVGQERDGQIWDLLKEVFEKLNNSEFSSSAKTVTGGQVIYYYFLWNLLSILGYKSDLYHCASCGNKLLPEKNCFIPKNGILCRECVGDRQKMGSINFEEVSQDVIKILRILENRGWDTLVRLKTEKTHLEELGKILAIPENK